jgi:hypothetical protein
MLVWEFYLQFPLCQDFQVMKSIMITNNSIVDKIFFSYFPPVFFHIKNMWHLFKIHKMKAGVRCSNEVLQPKYKEESFSDCDGCWCIEQIDVCNASSKQSNEYQMFNSSI